MEKLIDLNINYNLQNKIAKNSNDIIIEDLNSMDNIEYYINAICYFDKKTGLVKEKDYHIYFIMKENFVFNAKIKQEIFYKIEQKLDLHFDINRLNNEDTVDLYKKISNAKIRFLYNKTNNIKSFQIFIPVNNEIIKMNYIIDENIEDLSFLSNINSKPNQQLQSYFENVSFFLIDENEQPATKINYFTN